MNTDRMTEEADWKDGINAFRNKSYKEFTEIYHSLAKIEEEINKIKQQIKGETP
jgi:hypothetical protein